MKAKIGQVPVSEGRGNEQVRKEISSFLQALDSYPKYFARNPLVSFEQHRSSLAEAVERDRRAASV